MFSITVKRTTHVKLPSQIIGPRRIKVGFPAGETDSHNIQKAVWNEFGTAGGASGGGWGGPVPERPAMRNAIRSNAGSYKTALKASASKLLLGKTNTRAVLSKLGNKASSDIKDEITSLSSPPNSLVTIALKGSSNPLIDTGEMVGSVTWKIDQ
ncbi:hypothetical protein [Pararhizobium sp.]|uniref:hypothetical protein n=1 Tax=Pararhizobium sp. TaxID=1977563 RepID=UPI002721B813|nr:hypothetical protein [Pararhizobium sp.]MDO9417031.1 hypothetical protein [Pararhizobium sp.]